LSDGGLDGIAIARMLGLESADLKLSLRALYKCR
jgi:hypothetical protein